MTYLVTTDDGSSIGSFLPLPPDFSVFGPFFHALVSSLVFWVIVAWFIVRPLLLIAIVWIYARAYKFREKRAKKRSVPEMEGVSAPELSK